MISFHSVGNKISKLFPPQETILTQENQNQFRIAQRLAYDCAIQIGREIQEGWSEQKTAHLMDTFLRDHGVRTFFHTSFAWFGERSRFDGINKGLTSYFGFLPSKRVFKGTDVVILDTAPFVNGYAADIGFTFSLMPNPELAAARAVLLSFRKLIPQLFLDPQRNLGDIWNEVDQKFQTMGYDNCHSRYPLQALGHRLHFSPFTGLPGLVTPFSLQSYWSLLSRGLFPEVISPWHQGSKNGLWAIEPHLGGPGFGAKFEEILVVDEVGVQWLDDSVPHLNLPEGFY